MAETSVGNLSLKISSSVTRSVNAINKLTASLRVANEELAKMSALTQANPVTININKISGSVKNLEKQSKQATKGIQTMSNTLSSLKNVLLFNIGFGSLQQGIRTVTTWFRNGFNEASQFVENFNLFNVSMRGSTEEAIKYQNQLNYSMKVNMSESMRYQGFFKNLANSLGITNDASTLLSTNLTNLTYDLSSLYNVDFSTMYSKLQSGIVGQTKPLRSVGIDVTQQTLQPLLYEMGINKYVTELTQAEKVLLRYISIIKQSESAHGDFARTIETPANQIRIFNDQIKEMTRWFGTIFIGTLGKVLPYINAVVITLKEVFKWISLLFGFNVEDYDFLGAQEDSAIGFGDALEDDLSSAEKLKKSLMGFDEINNIGEESSGSSLPNIGLSDTYYKLLDNLKGYDNLMGGISTKAGEISEKILAWLGFTKFVNEETGEVIYKLENFSLGAWSVVGAIGALIAIPFVGFIANIAKFLGFNKGFEIMGGLATKIGTNFDKIGFALANLNPIVVVIIAIVALFVGALVDLWKNSEEFRTKVGNAIETVTGIFTTFYNTIKPYLDIIYNGFVALWEYGIKPLWEGWVKFVDGVMSLMFALLEVASPVLDTLAWLFGEVLGVVSLLIPVFTTVVTIVVGSLGWALNGLGEILKWLADKIVWFKDNWDTVWGNIGRGFANFFKPVTDFFNGFVTWFADKINALIATYNAIPILGDVGYINVPSPKPKPSPKPVTGTGGGGGYGHNVGMYANGGIPDKGELFIANEGAPELVGSFGTRTGVMNNQQIVEAVAQGVARAVSSVMNKDNGDTQVVLQVGEETLGRVSIKAINKTMKNTSLVLDV